METIKLKIICPICENEKVMKYPTSIILDKKDNQSSLYIPEGLVCNHKFQALVDKNFKIVKYQLIHIV
ncbi:MAG: hypothetical protein ACFFD7_04495 [Candidatus Thorarchaeota archaeon]